MIIKPKGCHDIYGYEAKRWQYVSKVIDSLMENIIIILFVHQYLNRVKFFIEV